MTFDVGGTLLKVHPSVGHVYSEVAALHGPKIAPDLLNRRFSAAWSKLVDFTHTREEWATLVDAVFEGLVPNPPGVTFFDEVYARFAAPSAWRMFNDVIPAFEELASKGYQIGIISNWDERLRPLLNAFGLANYAETIVVSCETGFPKPSPVIFEIAARKLGLPPAQILHIGDSAAHDEAGARAAGFRSLLLDRNRDEPVSDDRICTLSQLRNLPSLLKSEVF